MERELKEAAKLRRWTDEQINGVLALLQEHAGYLYAHGHALALAHHVVQQARRKLDPATAPAFFAEVLNNGGSAHYGLGAAVEEARQWGILILPPCVNRSSDRYAAVDPDSLELIASTAQAGSPSGGIRVPLTAIRGLGAGTVRQILQMRAIFGPFSSLLDFLRRMEPHQISRRELQVLIRLGAFSFTGRSRAQLALVEDIYAAPASSCERRIATRQMSVPWKTNCPVCLPRIPMLSSGHQSGSPRTSSHIWGFTSSHVTSSRTPCASPRSSRRWISPLSQVSRITLS
jgi:DNA polymerase III alpha subunit